MANGSGIAVESKANRSCNRRLTATAERLTDVAHRSAVSAPTVAHVVGLVESDAASVATGVRLTGVTRCTRRQGGHVRTARQHLELRRDAREVEHSPVDEHFLETS